MSETVTELLESPKFKRVLRKIVDSYLDTILGVSVEYEHEGYHKSRTEIARLMGVTPMTIFRDIKKLKIVPVERINSKVVLYDIRDFPRYRKRSQKGRIKFILGESNDGKNSI